MNTANLYKYLFWISFTAFMVFTILETWLKQYSGFGAGLLKATIGIILFAVFDIFVMKDIDTFQELKKGNVAYALFLLAYSIVIAAAIASE